MTIPFWLACFLITCGALGLLALVCLLWIIALQEYDAWSDMRYRRSLNRRPRNPDAPTDDAT